MVVDHIEACPFCGSSNVDARVIHALPEPRHIVVCRDCSARGPGKTKQDQAIAAWNKRTMTQ